MKRTVIITMAGEGSRFKALGLSAPKHLLYARGKTLFEWSVLSLENFFDWRFVFICRETHHTVDFIHDCCGQLGLRDRLVLEIPTLTGGQADTAMLAAPFVSENANPVLIYNIDTYVESSALKPSAILGAGWIPAFEAEGDRWSFVDFDQNYRVHRVTEKIRISNYGTVGLYYFDSFCHFAAALAAHSFPSRTERYIAPIYNELIAQGLEIYTSLVPRDKVHVLGTPEDLLLFDPSFRAG